MKLPYLLIVLLLAGCSIQPNHAPSVSTASLSGHITAVQSGLSAIDGKSTVVQSWLSTH